MHSTLFLDALDEEDGHVRIITTMSTHFTSDVVVDVMNQWAAAQEEKRREAERHELAAACKTPRAGIMRLVQLAPTCNIKRYCLAQTPKASKEPRQAKARMDKFALHMVEIL